MSKKSRPVKTKSTGSDLEAMLRDLDTRSNEFRIDLDVGGESGATNLDTPVDFSVSKELVARDGAPGTDESVVGRELARMSDFEFLDADSLQKKRIVYPSMDEFSLMNSFREIRTRLLQKSENNNFVLIVASINHDMGATFTTVNLGAAFSYEGERTALLIDCQSHGENLSKLLGSKDKKGLTDYFNRSDVELREVIYSTGISRMRLIPVGSSGAEGLKFLTSERMSEFLGTLKRRHKDRFIFINAPPLEVSADAAILSEIADYILVVVPYGKVSKNRLNKAMKSLPVNKVVGVVMNDCKRYA